MVCLFQSWTYTTSHYYSLPTNINNNNTKKKQKKITKATVTACFQMPKSFFIKSSVNFSSLTVFRFPHCILLFPKKGDFGIVKSNRGVTLTSIAAKIYNSLQLNCIESENEKILRKNYNGCRKNRSITSQILTICRILGVGAKTSRLHLFNDFSKAFDSIHRGKMEQMPLASGQPKEAVAAIMMHNKNTKVKFRSPDGDTDFDIVAGVL